MLRSPSPSCISFPNEYTCPCQLNPEHPRNTVLQEDLIKNRVFAFLVVFSALLCIVAPLAAQDDAGIYYREALWDVKRTHWSSYEENFTKNQKPILDKLFAEGVITEWGMDTLSIHTEDGYTHANWWSGKDLASLQRVIDAFDERDEQLSEAERKKRTAELTDSIQNHRDGLGRSLVFRSRSTETDEGFFFTSSVQVKPGKGREYRESWEKRNKATYERLLNEGTILAYGMDVQFIHTDAPGGFSVLRAVPSLEADAKVRAALRANDTRTPEERQAMRQALFVEGSHRDSMSRIIHYVVKGAEAAPTSP